MSFIVFILLIAVGGAAYYFGSQKSDDKEKVSTSSSSASDEKNDSTEIEYVEFKELGIKVPKDSLKDLKYEIKLYDAFSNSVPVGSMADKSAYIIYFTTDKFNVAFEKCFPSRDSDSNYFYDALRTKIMKLPNSEKNTEDKPKVFADGTHISIFTSEKPFSCEDSKQDEGGYPIRDEKIDGLYNEQEFIYKQVKESFSKAELTD